MGDPLSVAASILTLLGAGGAVGNFLKKVLALKHAPDILLALNNDIVDLQRVVQAVDELLREHSRMIDKAPLDHVSESLGKVKKTLSTLEHIVSYELTVVERDGSHLRLDRSMWLRVENKIRSLREEIRANKADLCLSLTLLTNCTSLRGVIQSQALQTSVTDLEDQIRRTARTVFSQLDITEQSLRVGLEDQRQHKLALHQLRTCLDEDRVNGRTLNNRVQALEVLLREVRDRQQMQTQSLLEIKRNAIQYHERDWELSHQPRAIEASLTQPLGRHRPKIDLLPGIKERQLNLKSNPTMNLNTPADQAVALFPSRRESSVKRPRVVPTGNEDEEWMIHRLKRLLDDGEVSVLDVDEEGLTILHHAFLLESFGVAELLIRCGADLYHQNDWGRSAFVEAWDIFLAQPSLVEGKKFLRDQLWDQSHLDLLGFTQLQKAYFGLSGVTYHMALSGTLRSAIDEVDAMGRTILSWASQKGDDTTVAELLACGADPNINDSYGTSCLHYAALGCSESCVRLLLASKAELEVKNSEGETPLAYAARRVFGGLMVLMEFGADMEAQDREGWRPVHAAVVYDQAQNVRHLMHAGADIFARTSAGNTALDLAVYDNNHSTLRVLLQTSAGPTINVSSDIYLSQAVRYADQETLEILHLAVSKGFHLRVRVEDNQETDLFKTAEWRRDYNQEWSESVLRRPDTDSSAWFHSFELLEQAMNGGQSRISEDRDGERQLQPGYDEEQGRSDTATVDKTESEEIREDCHPQLGHSAGEESPGTESDDENENEESWEDARES